jgi:hypothetical protein
VATEKAAALEAEKATLQKACSDKDEALKAANEAKAKAEAEIATAKSASDVAKSLEVSNKELSEKVAKMEAQTEIQKLMDGELADLKEVTKVEPIAIAVQKLRSIDKDSLEVVLSLAKALAKQVKEGGLFTVIGKDGDTAAAEDKVDALAKELSKKENISFEKAYARVLTENPSLYEELNSNGGK